MKKIIVALALLVALGGVGYAVAKQETKPPVRAVSDAEVDKLYNRLFDESADDSTEIADKPEMDTLRTCYKEAGIPSPDPNEPFEPLPDDLQRKEEECFDQAYGQWNRVQEASTKYVKEYANLLKKSLDSEEVRSAKNSYIQCMSHEGISAEDIGNPTGYERSSMSEQQKTAHRSCSGDLSNAEDKAVREARKKFDEKYMQDAKEAIKEALASR